MALEAYNRKRNFTKTSEPKGQPVEKTKAAKALRFVVQEHHASRLHFDLRLEMGGVLKSWAVPKGPSLNPADKRLAVMTEDHPLKYIDFEGHIPEGNYGAGDMGVWDSGTYTLFDESKDPEEGAAAGKLHLCFHGKKLKGEFKLFRFHAAEEENQWLLVKADDEHADRNWQIENIIADPKYDKAKKPAARQTATKARVPKAAKTKNASTEDIAAVEGAQKKTLPAKLNPMLATLVDKPPLSDDWLYEIKWDGYRLACFIENGKVRLMSRNHNDLTPLFPAVAEALGELPVKRAIIDGEVVALDEDGAPSFQLLQNSTKIRNGIRSRKGLANPSTDAPIVLYAFDLPYIEGYDLTRATLLNRKSILAPLIENQNNGIIRYSEHFEGRQAGEALYAQAGKEGLEGVIAKHRDSHYLERRTDYWLKVKIEQRMDVVIAGYTAPRESREYFGALILGVYEEGELRYVGHTGTGFNRASLKEMYDMLQPLRQTACPFKKKPVTNATPQWVKPQLVCEIKFGEMTADERLRHPVYMGLRHDKEPDECRWEKKEDIDKVEVHAETEVEAENATSAPTKPATAKKAAAKPAEPKPSATKTAAKGPIVDVSALLEDGLRRDLNVQAGGHVVSLTNLHKTYWGEDGFTKGDLLRYYYQVSEFLLPYLKDRPLILKRYPNGIDSKFFFQHDVENPPPFLRIMPNTEKGEIIHYAICDNLASLLYLVNLGTITQNSWHSREGNVTRPDWLIFDLDPGEVPYSAVCELALVVEKTLSSLKLKSYVKTSGSSGMHVYMPAEPVYSYEQLRDFGIVLAELICRERPDLATTQRALKTRAKNLIYLDVLQNHEGKTVATPWSVRARPGAPVSTPLSWREVKAVPEPGSFNIETVLKGIKRRDGLFAPVLEGTQRIEEALGLLDKKMRGSK